MYDNPKGGIGYAAEFQSSALPWVTSSVASNDPVRYDFFKVSRFITVSNTDSTGSLGFGFTRAGVVSTSNKYVLNPGQAVTLETRIKSLWLIGELGGTPTYSVFAGLTNIDANNMPLLSGTLQDGSLGWIGIG